MHRNGIFGFLIGESLMRSEQPGAKLRELFPAD
jgi:indole-3-glycerol phosphate synthase